MGALTHILAPFVVATTAAVHANTSMTDKQITHFTLQETLGPLTTALTAILETLYMLQVKFDFRLILIFNSSFPCYYNDNEYQTKENQN